LCWDLSKKLVQESLDLDEDIDDDDDEDIDDDDEDIDDDDEDIDDEDAKKLLRLTLKLQGSPLRR
jgi:hypothetical protein